MRVLIVEDEPLAEEELERLIVSNFPEADIVERIATVEDSIKWLQKNSADLIFMDIHLADGVSFDIFEKVKVDTPIIFTTAYDQYAIDAFSVNGIGYILKPINEQKLIDAVNKYKKTKYSSDELHSLLRDLKGEKKYKTRITIKIGDRINFLNIDYVAYFFAEDRTNYVVDKKGTKQIVDYNIEALESMLDPMKFFRLTRGCLASIDSIDRVSKWFNSRLKITLKPSYEGEILVSRARVGEFMKWLDGEST